MCVAEMKAFVPEICFVLSCFETFLLLFCVFDLSLRTLAEKNIFNNQTDQQKSSKQINIQTSQTNKYSDHQTSRPLTHPLNKSVNQSVNTTIKQSQTNQPPDNQTIENHQPAKSAS